MTIDYRIGTLEDVLMIDAKIPEFAHQRSTPKNTLDTLAERLSHKRYLLLVAVNGHEPVAYKLGYALSDRAFYSWLGAVMPAHRRQGIAAELRRRQERWAIEQGFSQICVKSMNRFPAMLQLLIRSGYSISGYEDGGTPESSKVLFSKLLES